MNGKLARVDYLTVLESFKDTNDVVKVLTGMRRCGKTSILEQYIDSLRKSGVPEEDIFYLDFEKRSGQDLKDRSALDSYFAGRLSKERQTYVFLNNIMCAEKWDQVVNRLLSFGKCDIYIVESLVKPIVDALSQHGPVNVEEIKVYPYSFKDYLEVNPSKDIDESLKAFARYGGLPEVHISRGERECDAMLEGIFNTIVLNDLILKNNDDPRKLMAITKYLYTHIGKLTSIPEIAKACGISSGSAERIVSDLEAAYLICRADRYDVNMGIKKEQPFVLYATDNGIRDFALKFDTEFSMDLAMENIVYLELKRRGYKVRAGSVHEDGTTFTAIDGDDHEYYKVVSSLDSMSCEIKDVIDNANRIVLTFDRDVNDSCGKAKVVNICDWLLN